MAAKTKSKDVRSLMKEQRNKSKKKIDSPLARYSNAGQLFCVLCNTIIKSDLLWDAHIRGIKHKENLVSLKSGQQKSQTGSTRKNFPRQDKNLNDYNGSKVDTVASTSSRSNKRRTEDNNTLDLRTETTAIKKAKVSSGNVSSSIPADFFDEDANSSVNEQNVTEDNDVETTSASAGPSEMSISDLPADFFDSSRTETEETENENLTKEKESSDKSEDAIPEGFFDDPKLDAKARKVQYKDPADEEWEKFQKALSTENQVSEAIIHEEEEESRIDRALDEISEQRLYYIRADVLRDKQNAFKKGRENKNERHNVEMEEDSDTDSDDIEDMFNWRAKKAL